MPSGPRLQFCSYEELNGRPNIVVDGSPTGGTVLCLTHWPHIESPARYRGDLSAEMAFRYAENRRGGGDATLVSNNHFDQDGLVSMYALTHPAEAAARRDLLIDVAHAGDFATSTTLAAARISMTLSAYATPGRSPISDLAADYSEMTAQLYEEMLPLLGDLCDHPDRYKELWEEEDATLRESQSVLASGRAALEEVPDLDLAVFVLPEDGPRSGGHRFGGRWVPGLHPMALHGRTERFAMLVIREQSYEFTYRYETWVQYQSRRPRARVDLSHLTDELNANESGPGVWRADPVSELTPGLRLEGAQHSAMSPSTFRLLLEAHLRKAPPAWDPYLHERTG